VTQNAGTTPTVATDPQPGDYRTLVDSTKDYTLNATYTMPLSKKVMSGTLAINGTAARTDTTGLNGLNTVTLTGPNNASAVRTFPAR
jgi:hypothetical protein